MTFLGRVFVLVATFCVLVLALFVVEALRP